MAPHRQWRRRLRRAGSELLDRYGLGRWCRQRRAIHGAIVAFAVGAGAILLWQPELIADFPRDQFMDGYVVSGLLLIGLTAASCGEETDALAFGLYALGYGILVAPLLSDGMATLGAIACFSLTVLLAETHRTSPDGGERRTDEDR